MPLSITLEYWVWLMHMAIALRRVALLKGAAEVFSMTHCMVGWPTTWPLLSSYAHFLLPRNSSRLSGEFECIMSISPVWSASTRESALMIGL